MSHTPQSLQHEHVLFLNGLRGLAALMVFFDHTKQMINRINPFYYSDYFIFITNGTVGVHLLFVISGFALSLQFLRKRDIRIVLNLAAKRYPRLMIPILVACFLSYCLMSAGLMANATLPAAMQNKWFSQFFDFSPSFLGMLKFSVYDVFMNYNPKTAYITVLWSIAPEFTGSMLLLGALLFSHYGRWRIATYVLICLPMAFSNTVFFGFLIGVLLAEAYENKTVQQFRTQRYALPVSLICLAIGITLITVSPNMGLDYYDSRLLKYTVATLMALAAIISAQYARFFESKPMLFLGDISFSLYLTHFLVICTASAHLLTYLLTHDYSMTVSANITIVFSIIYCIITAVIFNPVDKFAITCSRRFTQKFFRSL